MTVYVYFILDGDCVKIGTSKHPLKRMMELQIGNPRILTLLAALPGGVKRQDMLHEYFARYRERGEWFRVEGELATMLEWIREEVGDADSD